MPFPPFYAPLSVDIICQLEASPLYALEIARKLGLEVTDWSLGVQNGRVVITLVSPSDSFSATWAEKAATIQDEIKRIEGILVAPELAPAEIAIVTGVLTPNTESNA